MKTRAAVLMSQPGPWEVVELELDEPQDREVLVRFTASGLCHSDEHYAKGDLPAPRLPYCGGHEAAGVIEAVGPGVNKLAVGDHIVVFFVPPCGRCERCGRGQQNLCDNAQYIDAGGMLDRTYRKHLGGQDVSQSCFAGTFSEWSVIHESSCVKIPDHVPLRSAALLGCGVPTGWGSAVYAAQTEPGDTTIVMGAGGVGIHAVQGAKHAGAENVIVADPVAFKREVALEVGATHAVASIDEAADIARSLTNGQGANAAIVAVGVLTGEHVAAACNAIGKSGTVVMTAVASRDTVGIPINLNAFAMYQKRIQGVLFGMCSPFYDVPRLLSMYESKILKLDEIISHTYSLEDINVGYADMYAGKNIRGLIEFSK